MEKNLKSIRWVTSKIYQSGRRPCLQGVAREKPDRLMKKGSLVEILDSIKDHEEIGGQCQATITQISAPLTKVLAVFVMTRGTPGDKRLKKGNKVKREMLAGPHTSERKPFGWKKRSSQNELKNRWDNRHPSGGGTGGELCRKKGGRSPIGYSTGLDNSKPVGWDYR